MNKLTWVRSISGLTRNLSNKTQALNFLFQFQLNNNIILTVVYRWLTA